MSGTNSVQHSRQGLVSRIISPAAVGSVCTLLFIWVLDIPIPKSILGGAIAAIGTLIVVHCALHREHAEYKRVLNERNRMFNLSMDMICVAGFDGFLKEVNPAFEQITGWTRDEWLTTPFIEKTHPDDRPRVEEVMKTLSEEKPLLDFESRTLCKDGSYRWFSINSFPVVRDGVVYAICRDITERKNAQQAILQLNQQLQNRADMLDAANKELEAFSYSVSHDLRVPLRHVVAFVQLLRKNAAAGFDGTNLEHLDIIEKATSHMGVLIDDLLEFSRMGKADLRLTCVSPGELIHAVIRSLTDENKGRNIEWTVHDLPALNADLALLKLAFVNLLGNAVKYTRPRMQARIEIGISHTPLYNPLGNQAVIFIKDNGVGFDMQNSERLFNVFQRLHNASDFEGTGIGLANVKRIVNRHGGRVWADGTPDVGATFFISLPIAERL